MDRTQFSLAGMLATVLGLAIACAAIMSDRAFVAGAASTICLGLLAFGIVGICCRRERKRVFWIGFTVFGLTYANASNQLPIEPFGYIGSRHTALVTEELLRYIASQKKFRPEVGMLVDAKWATSGRYYQGKIIDVDDDGQVNVEWSDGTGKQLTAPTAVRANWTSHYETGRAVFCILIAFFGGLLARTVFVPVTAKRDGESKGPE